MQMSFIQEYGLLIAIAAPVAVIVAIQVFLFMKGERGTLLLPSLRPYPSVKSAEALPKATQLVVIERRVIPDRRVAVARRVEEEELEQVA
jgi:hypothetical protein